MLVNYVEVRMNPSQSCNTHKSSEKKLLINVVLSIFKNIPIEVNQTQKNRSDRKSFIKNRWSIKRFFNLKFLVTSKSLLVALSYDKMA